MEKLGVSPDVQLAGLKETERDLIVRIRNSESEKQANHNSLKDDLESVRQMIAEIEGKF